MEAFHAHPFTLGFIAINVLMHWLTADDEKIKLRMLLWPPGVTRDHQYDRLVEYGFVHADFAHLFFNMFTLYFFGGTIEALYAQNWGVWAFPAFYLLALVASILPSYLAHRNDPNYRSLGASGAVSACLFAFILVAPWEKIYLYGALGIPAILYAVGYVGYSLWMAKQGDSRVNHAAHLWGALFGVVVTALVIPGIPAHFIRALANPGG